MLLSSSMHTYYLLSVVFRFIILIILFVSIVSIVITDTTLSVYYIVLHLTWRALCFIINISINMFYY